MTSEEIQRDIETIRLLRAQTSRWRLGLIGAFIAILVIGGIVLWSSASNLGKDGPDRQKFVSDLSADLQNNVIPDAMGIGKDAISQINFQEEFTKLNSRAPDVANAASEQVKKLAEDLPDQSVQTLDDQFDKALKERQAKLKTEFPQATDEQLATLMTGLTTEAHTQVTILADSLFSPHIETLNNIVADLTKIESEENPDKAEMPTWQMVFLVSDIARSDFAQLQSQADKEAKAADEAAKKAEAKAAALKKKKS
jgi:hypothetical protein